MQTENILHWLNGLQNEGAQGSISAGKQSQEQTLEPIHHMSIDGQDQPRIPSQRSGTQSLSGSTIAPESPCDRASTSLSRKHSAPTTIPSETRSDYVEQDQGNTLYGLGTRTEADMPGDNDLVSTTSMTMRGKLVRSFSRAGRFAKPKMVGSGFPASRRLMDRLLH